MNYTLIILATILIMSYYFLSNYIRQNMDKDIQEKIEERAKKTKNKNYILLIVIAFLFFLLKSKDNTALKICVIASYAAISIVSLSIDSKLLRKDKMALIYIFSYCLRISFISILIYLFI